MVRWLPEKEYITLQPVVFSSPILSINSKTTNINNSDATYTTLYPLAYIVGETHSMAVAVAAKRQPVMHIAAF